MATYLLKWSAKRYRWDDMQENTETVRTQGYCELSWSCGGTKRVAPGDRVFLIRLGEDPKGIVASGCVSHGPHEEPHWDIDKRKEGKRARFACDHRAA